MKITIITEKDQVKEIDFDATAKIEDVKVVLEIEFGIPSDQQEIYFNNQLLEDYKLLQNYCQNNDMVRLCQKRTVMNSNLFSSIFSNNNSQSNQLAENLANIFKNVTSNSQNSFYLTEAQKVKKHYTENPRALQHLMDSNPKLGEAVLSSNIQDLVKYIQEEQQERTRKKIEQAQLIQQLESDPFNPENQKKIQEIIEQQQIDQNLEMAQEYMPEVFGKITMLYIDICINDRQVQAFVDTGAESTIISKQCAERCGIMRLVDKRFSGIASGVGTGKILGRIHSYHIQILDQKIPCSFTVIETINLDFLLGLDTLRRFQCLVDLGKNCLTFSLQNRKLDVPFLYEADIKKSVSMELEKQLFEEEDKRNQLNNQNNIKNQNQQQIPQQQQKYQQIQQQPQKQQQQQHQQQQQFSQFPEASIQQLINIGATRQEAIKALTLAHGNLEYAASYIYNQKYGFQE